MKDAARHLQTLSQGRFSHGLPELVGDIHDVDLPRDGAADQPRGGDDVDVVVGSDQNLHVQLVPHEMSLGLMEQGLDGVHFFRSGRRLAARLAMPICRCCSSDIGLGT